MELTGQAVLLRVFVGESDKVRHKPLYEAIVQEARSCGLAGATVLKGVLAFGPTSRIRTAKVLDLSADLPLVVEIVDEESKVEAFRPRLDKLFEQADSGGLVTLEKVQIVRYLHAPSHSRRS